MPGIETLILKHQLTIAKLIKTCLTILLRVVKTMLDNPNNTATERIGYAGPLQCRMGWGVASAGSYLAVTKK